MMIRFRRIGPLSIMPTRGSEKASGLDLYADCGGVLRAGETGIVATGVAVQCPPGMEGQIRGRSSLSRKGILCALGTIDNDYRGEIKVTLTNTSLEPFFYDSGDRIAQLVIAPVCMLDPIEVDELSSTARGEGGFGSSGK